MLRDDLTPRSLDWVPLESSALSAAAYRVHRRHLYLRFHSGEVYCYFDFPLADYEALLSSSSKGRHFIEHIRDEFDCERVSKRSAAGRA